MTRSSPPQLSFSSGEISPLLAARHDYQRFQTGLAACRGFLPLRQGGITRAPGTWHRGQTYLDAEARLIAFQFAVDDAVVLEFTPGWMRVWRYGALVMSGANPYRLATPYDLAAIRRLHWVQSADVIYMVDGQRPIQKLSRFALNNWTIEDLPLSTGPFRNSNLDDAITVQASNATGTVTLTGVGNPFSADMVGSLILIEPVDFSAVALWTGNQAIAVGERMRYADNIYQLTAGSNTGVNPPVHLQGEQKYDNVAGTTWRFLSDGQGIVRITGYTNPNSVSGRVVRRLPEPVITSPTPRWSLGAWSSRHGYPATIEIYEQRLVAAATPTDPRTIWFSAAGDFSDFLPSTEADGAFAYAIAGRQSLNRILWVTAGQRALHIGALGEEYSTRSGTAGAAIGPTTAVFGFDSSYGSLDGQRPIAPDGKPIFLSRDGRRVIELAYSFDADANVPRELSLPAEHIGQAGLLELAWQSAPLRLAWVRRSAGDLAVMVYDPAEDVLGWAVYPVAGGAVESIAVTASVDGSADTVTLVVRRDIDGVTRRFVEEQAVVYGAIAGDEPIANANHLFCARAFAPATPRATFVLDHLPLTEVYAWTDGGQFGPLTTDATGSVDLGWNVGKAIIGLIDQTHRAETVPLVAPGRDGSAIGRKRRLHPGSGIQLHRTAGGSVRTRAWDFGRDPLDSGAQDILPVSVGTDAVAAWSGARAVQVQTHAADNVSIEIRPDGAKPLTVLAIVPRIEEVG